MTAFTFAPEFRKKSNSRRRKIFEKRARKILGPFFVQFSKENEDAISNVDVNKVIDNIIKRVRSDAKINTNESRYSTEEEFIEILLRENSAMDEAHSSAQ